MALSHGRVVKVGETLYPHEQEGIAFAIATLPDTDPYHDHHLSQMTAA